MTSKWVLSSASKNDPLDNVAPSVYLNKSLIPRVETKFKTESALRFTKQKSDIRSTIDGRKIKKYKDTGRLIHLVIVPFKFLQESFIV